MPFSYLPFLVLLCSPFCLPAQFDSIALQQAKILRLRMQADALVEKGKYEQSLPYWLEIIETEPNNPEHYYRRSRVFERMRDYGAAISDCHILIRLEPESMRGYWRRAELYFLQNKYHHVLADLDRALYHAEHPKDKASILFDRAYCYEKLCEYAKAKQDYLLLLESYTPEDAIAMSRLGAVYHHFGQNDSALYLIKASVLLRDDYLRTYIVLGMLHRRMGNYPEALLALDYVTESFFSAPADQKSKLLAILIMNLHERALCHAASGNWRAASSDWRWLRRLNPKYKYLFYVKGELLWARGRQAAACRCFQKAQHLIDDADCEFQAQVQQRCPPNR